MVDAIYRHGALPLSFGKSDFGEKQQGFLGGLGM